MTPDIYAEAERLWWCWSGAQHLTHTLSADSFFCPSAKLETVSGSGSRPKRRQQAVVPEREAGGSSSGLESLAAALEAVNTLAFALTAAEADAANEEAVRAVLPLLRAANDSSRVEVVRDGIKQLHMAAVKGELAEPGLQQKVQNALRCLATEVGTSAVLEAGKRKAPEGSSCSNKKQQRISVEAGDSGAPVTIDEILCQVCGIAEGADMIVCDWCAASAGHLGCLGFTEVPADSWFCSSTCEVHREAAAAAANCMQDGFWGHLEV